MGIPQFKAVLSSEDCTYYAQTGDDIRFQVSFTLKNEDGSNVKLSYEVESPDALGAIAKAVPMSKRDYPLATGEVFRSDKFLEYAQVLVRKAHD